MSIKLLSLLGLAAAASAGAASPALAHPMGHGELTQQAWLEHLLADPYHAGLAAVLFSLLLLFGCDLFPRLYRRCKAMLSSRGK